MVITSEDSRRDQKSVISEVVSFVGLCEYDFGSMQPEHVSRVNMPAKHAWDNATYMDLRQFYAPHNRRLYDLIGRDLGWENLRWKARRL